MVGDLVEREKTAVTAQGPPPAANNWLHRQMSLELGTLKEQGPGGGQLHGTAMDQPKILAGLGMFPAKSCWNIAASTAFVEEKNIQKNFLF